MSAIDEILGLDGIDADPAPLGKTESNSSMLAHAARKATGSVTKLHKGFVHAASNTGTALKKGGGAAGSAVGKTFKAPIVKADALASYLRVSVQQSEKPDQLASAGSAAAEINPEQHAWESFSTWLQKTHLKGLTLPHDLPINDDTPPVPAWGPEDSGKLKRVSVLKRFNSRKLPHLLELENDEGLVTRLIFKQDDDISMDVSVMNLFQLCNEIWQRRGLPGYLRTYKVIACPDLTGFGEIVPGETMLGSSTESMAGMLGEDKDSWHRLMCTLVGVVVSTAIFDITDRHHNNVLFTPDCELALIDLSASLGKVAPMDKALRMNPVYMPQRIIALREIYNARMEKMGYDPDKDMRRWQDVEEAALAHYFAIYNDLNMEKVLSAINYKMLKPHIFHQLLHERKSKKQVSEGMRNTIVNAMDENDTINALVAGITRVIPMN